MDLNCFIETKELSINRDKLSGNNFIDRVFFCIKEDCDFISYTSWYSKVMQNGIIKTLKSLNLYITKGRGLDKKIYVHKKIYLIYITTCLSPKELAKNIIAMVNGEFSGTPKIKIESFVDFNSLKDFEFTKLNNGYFTYILLNTDNMLSKIGRTKNISNRINSIKRDSATENIHLISLKSIDIEGYLHNLMKDKNVYGEWFKLDYKDVSFIVDDNDFDYKNKELFNLYILNK